MSDVMTPVASGLRDFAERWALDRRFTAAMESATRARKIALWRDAVARTLSAKAVR